MAISATVSGRVAEVFYSIQGEGAPAGLPAVYARLLARHGFRFSPRLHVMLWGARRGV